MYDLNSEAKTDYYPLPMFKKGDKVAHPIFGLGTISNIEEKQLDGTLSAMNLSSDGTYLYSPDGNRCYAIMFSLYQTDGVTRKFYLPIYRTGVHHIIFIYDADNEIMYAYKNGYRSKILTNYIMVDPPNFYDFISTSGFSPVNLSVQTDINILYPTVGNVKRRIFNIRVSKKPMIPYETMYFNVPITSYQATI